VSAASCFFLRFPCLYLFFSPFAPLKNVWPHLVLPLFSGAADPQRPAFPFFFFFFLNFHLFLTHQSKVFISSHPPDFSTEPMVFSFSFLFPFSFRFLFLQNETFSFYFSPCPSFPFSVLAATPKKPPLSHFPSPFSPRFISVLFFLPPASLPY